MEDYYAARGETPGRWIGGGCGGLGLSGQVNGDAFFALMEGRDPTLGEVLRPAHGRARVAAFDLTFSAPKSLSVLFAVADETVGQALFEAHDRAVDAALAYMEREACFTRRGKNGARRLRGEGFVAAAYRHRLSRAGDPQLHTHVVVANMTQAEGRWTALDGHGLYEHKSAAGAVYRGVLRAEVRERLAWVSWRQAGRGLFEIDGIPEGVLREFSRRRAEIEERARELTGVAASELSRERLEGIALATRRAKEYGVDGAAWREDARARAAEHGLGTRELRRLLSSRPRAVSVSELDVMASATERLSGPDGLTGQHNTFARRHVVAELAGEFVQGATVAQLERGASTYLQDSSVVGLGGGESQERFTTRELLASEQAIVTSARRRVRRDIVVLSEPAIDWSLRRGGIELNAEQAAAVKTIAVSGNGVDMLQALAGTGKTRVLGALASCYRDAGYQILGVAPTGRAARELGDAIGARAFTLHAVVKTIERTGDLLPRTVVLMDEAGMAPTRESAVLFEAAKRTGAKLITAGDVGQLPSIQAGGWFATLTLELRGPELRQVMRQRDPNEVAALEALHDGDADQYIALRQDRGNLHVHSDEHDALSGVLCAWDLARRVHGLGSAVMIAPDNFTRTELNERARAMLIDGGVLSAEAVRAGGREFRVGDRVIMRRNDRRRDVDNGTLAMVRAIHPITGALGVGTDANGHRELDLDYVSEHVEHAYALTGHATQGASVEWAGVVGRPSDFSAEWAYTALSRARGCTDVHLIAEPPASQQDREGYGPTESRFEFDEALNAISRALQRRLAESLAIEHMRQPGSRAVNLAAGSPVSPEPSTPGSVEHGVHPSPSRSKQLAPPGADWRKLRKLRQSRDQGPHLLR
jgi:conjugative relaxase-like TrwC/TraI family protein